MSDLLDPQAPAPPKEGKAQAKAEKAYAKAIRPWYKKKRFMIPAVVAAFAIFGSSLSGSDSVEPTPDAANSAAEVTADTDVAAPAEVDPAESTVGIGDAAQDGKFTFTVHSLDCGKKAVGNSFMEEKAQGQFCLLDVSVENHGNEAQMLFSDNQYIYDSKGRQFSQDSIATMSIEGNNDVWIEDINPGNSVRGVMVFDVPKNATIVSARLHDSMMSGGVVVTLQ